MKPRIPASVLPRGFTFSAAACGLKKSGLDLGLIVSETPAAAACVFTTNLVKAAPVFVSQAHLRKSADKMRAIIVNSGNANCATGAAGLDASSRTAKELAKAFMCRPEQILVCSTGVIGLPLRVERILRAIPELNASRSERPDSYAQLTRAIMTTDTRPKSAAANCRIGGKRSSRARLREGRRDDPSAHGYDAGVCCDRRGRVADVLRRALREAIGGTFNAITVDGDTSTNDTLALLANGASGARAIRAGTADYQEFRAALEVRLPFSGAANCG